MSQLATIDRRAATWGVLAVLVTLAIAVLGSGNLRWFDAALVGYLFGTLFAVFAVVYRYLIWLHAGSVDLRYFGDRSITAISADLALPPWRDQRRSGADDLCSLSGRVPRVGRVREIGLGLRGSTQHHVDDGSGRCGRALWGWGRG